MTTNTGVSKVVKEEVRRSLLTSDMNVRYWGAVKRRYTSVDLWMKIAVAITTSSSIAAWQIWKDIQWAWAGLSAVSAVISVINPFLKLTDKVSQLSRIHQKHVRTKLEYEKLWLSISAKTLLDEADIQTKFFQIREREEEVAADEANFPVNHKLLLKCHCEVRKSWNLPPPKKGDI